MIYVAGIKIGVAFHKIKLKKKKEKKKEDVAVLVAHLFG